MAFITYQVSYTGHYLSIALESMVWTIGLRIEQ